jgi:Flp pilus assembly protein TadB
MLGWALAALMVAVAWQSYGWQGVAFAVSLIVFWLVLQFNRSLRVLKNAANSPVGHVPSAVMFNARLKQGLTLLQVVTMTKSLGRQLSKSPETWQWRDDGGSSVTLVFDKARLKTWTLDRPEQPDATP